jgi:hypothetical protein
MWDIAGDFKRTNIILITLRFEVIAVGGTHFVFGDVVRGQLQVRDAALGTFFYFLYFCHDVTFLFVASLTIETKKF